LDFPIIDEDWTADEEMQLLDGIDSFGMGNWADISEQIGTKTTEETKSHYLKCYVESSCFPLPV